MTYLKMAWRNIWRNKRRTLITISAVLFAVLLCTLMRSLLEGVYTHMVDNVAGFSTGYLQVHKKGYWLEKNIDNSMPYTDSLFQAITNTNDVTAVAPRIETFALASTGSLTSGVVLTGTDPLLENNITHLQAKLTAGVMLQKKDRAVLIAEGLAKKLKLKVNDTLVLMTQGYHASSANGLYQVKGIVKIGSPELNKAMIYLPLEEAQQLLSLEQCISGISIMIRNSNQLNRVKSLLQMKLDTTVFEVMVWKEMLPELDQMIEADGSGHQIMLTVLYVMISFGVFSTVLMMLAERKHEFGIMIAIGMQKHQVLRIVMAETILLLVLGIGLGTLASWPVLQYFYLHPIKLSGELKTVYENYGFEAIIPVSKSFIVFWSQVKAVAFIGLFVLIYPVIHLSRFKLMQALRN
jgi:ABC-type lipoprotein release transport system permease subunit